MVDCMRDFIFIFSLYYNEKEPYYCLFGFSVEINMREVMNMKKDAMKTKLG